MRAAVVVLLIAVVACSPPPPASTDAQVLEVVDGDTLVVRVSGGEERVRLLGINAPEADECLGGDATARLAELTRSQDLSLERDRTDRDRFGRLLRYVHAGPLHVNARLVREGLALAAPLEPDTARAGELSEAERAARDERVGLWGDAPCGSAAARLEVGRIQPDPPGPDEERLEDEWVEVVNRGPEPVDLGGWVVADESASNRFAFPDGLVLEPGAAVRLVTGCGTDSPTVVHWCRRDAGVWSNSGDTVFLIDPDGRIADRASY